jgi:tetratricopeptide (TPR) repeat protein
VGDETLQFIPRPEMLGLLALARASRNPILVLYSSDGLPGGTGKTTLARALAAQLQSEGRFPGCRVLVDLQGAANHSESDVNQAIRNAKRQIIEDCGLLLPIEDDDAKLDRVYKSAFHSVGLLIIDDVWDHVPVEALLLDAIVSRTTPFCAVVTSRNHVGVPRSEACKIGVVPDDVAISMLKEYADNRRFLDSELHSVAKECGNIPLALRLVGRLLATTPDLTIDKMLHSRVPSAVQSAMENSLSLACEALDVDLWHTLQCAAVLPFRLSKVAFSEAVQFAFRIASVKKLDSCFTDLINRGLLSFVDKRYSMHDVVRSHVLCTLDNVSLADVLEKGAFAYFIRVVQDCEKMVRKREQVSAALSLFSQEMEGILWTMRVADEESLRDLNHVCGRLFILMVSADLRVTMYRKVLAFDGIISHFFQAISLFFFREPLSLMTRRRLGFALCDVGHYKEAKQLLSAVCVDSERVFGANDDRTRKVKKGLEVAREKSERGDMLVEADALCSVEVHSVAMNELLALLDVNGNSEEAEKSLGELLSAQLCMVGEAAHPRVLSAKINLAWRLAKRETYEEAEKLLREVLCDAGDRINRDVLLAKRRLAFVLSRQRKHEAAEKLLKDVVRSMPVDHPDWLSSKKRIGGDVFCTR